MTARFRAIPRWLASEWKTPPTLDRSLYGEWRLVGIRWIAVALVAPALALARLPLENLGAAYAILFAAFCLNVMYRWLIHHRPRLLAHGYLTTAGDGLLHAAMLMAGGGFGTPFYYIMFTFATSMAMRYGYRPSLIVVCGIVGLDSLDHLANAVPFDTWFAFRSIFLGLTCIVCSYMREQAIRAENALQARLHEANRLNEASADLAASLEMQTLFGAIAQAGARLFQSQHAVFRCIGEATGDGAAGTVTIAHYPEDGDDRLQADLQALCEQHPAESILSGSQAQRVILTTLASGTRAAAVALALPTRNVTWATLGCVVREGWTDFTSPDILDSFRERVALAIDNAWLYGALERRSVDLHRAYADLAAAHQELLRLVQVDEMKDAFLANVSHELRTPLSSIRAFSELILSYDDDPAVHKEFLQIINSESERLTRMVNNVLDVMKIESGNMDWNMAVIEPGALLKNLAHSFAPLIAIQRLGFEVSIEESLPSIHGDADRLAQVITNLLNNALKFTETGRISLAAVRDRDEVLISVADTGIGIAAADLERVFDRFHQVGPTLTGKPRGSGLGLTICREIVEHHGGRIWVDSEPGTGSTFTFSVKVANELRSGRSAAPSGFVGESVGPIHVSVGPPAPG